MQPEVDVPQDDRENPVDVEHDLRVAEPEHHEPETGGDRVATEITLAIGCRTMESRAVALDHQTIADDEVEAFEGRERDRHLDCREDSNLSEFCADHGLAPRLRASVDETDEPMEPPRKPRLECREIELAERSAAKRRVQHRHSPAGTKGADALREAIVDRHDAEGVSLVAPFARPQHANVRRGVERTSGNVRMKEAGSSAAHFHCEVAARRHPQAVCACCGRPSKPTTDTGRSHYVARSRRKGIDALSNPCDSSKRRGALETVTRDAQFAKSTGVRDPAETLERRFELVHATRVPRAAAERVAIQA